LLEGNQAPSIINQIRRAGETFETVKASHAGLSPPLKQGVNEKENNIFFME
jgi:hypothetical protein